MIQKTYKSDKGVQEQWHRVNYSYEHAILRKIILRRKLMVIQARPIVQRLRDVYSSTYRTSDQAIANGVAWKWHQRDILTEYKQRGQLEVEVLAEAQ